MHGFHSLLSKLKQVGNHHKHIDDDSFGSKRIQPAQIYGDDNTSTETKIAPLSDQERIAISAITSYDDQLTQTIHDIEQCLTSLDTNITHNNTHITRVFDHMIVATRQRKKHCVEQLRDVIHDKEEGIIRQINELTLYQSLITKFKAKTMTIKQEGVMDEAQIQDFILARSQTLISYHEEQSGIHCKSLIHTDIDIQCNVNEMQSYLDAFGVINGCRVPSPPSAVDAVDISYNSAQIELRDDHRNSDSEEYKIELRCFSDFELTNAVHTNASMAAPPRWKEVITFLSLEIELTNLRPNATYVIRVACKNQSGWSAWSASQKFKTMDRKSVMNNCRYQYIYLAPTHKYQRKLLNVLHAHGNGNPKPNATALFFEKCKGFHITVGPKLRCDENDDDQKRISNVQLIEELSSLGLKNANGCQSSGSKKWYLNEEHEYKVSKWKIGEQYFIVLAFGNEHRLLNVAATLLRAQGWKNVKHKNWNITLGVYKDLSHAQINELVDILTSKEETIEWNWFAVIQNERGEVEWQTVACPVYNL